jgi:hypothetical protein
MGARQRGKKVHPTCGNLAFSQSRPSHDRFSRTKGVFQVFEGGELPLQRLVRFHWLDHGRTMCNVVLRVSKVVVQKFPFIFVNCDDVTTIDNQSWLFVHVYVIKEWKRVLILLNLQCVVDEATSDNLTSLIVKNLMEFGSLSEIEFADKFVCFGVGEVTIF